MGGWSLDKKIISIYMGNPDNSNHAELELPATPWEMVDAMDRLRLSEGQEPYWQVEDMGRYEFLAPHLDGYDLYQFNALAEKLRTFGDVDAVAFEGLVQMELNNLYQNNGGDLTLRRVLDLAYSVDCCHVVPGITDDAALGQFYVENDFLPDLATVPDSVLEMLDYAAYHDEGHHPHVHMMVWSTEPKKGYLTREGIAAMRSRVTNAIFHEEIKELYIKKDAAYKESIQTAKESLLLYIRMLENSESADPVIEQKLCDLSHALEQVDGKHVYGYLPKEVKAQVDEIVEQLAQLPELAACYEQWWKLKDEIAGYYGRNTPPHQPLVQQKEFRTIKNMIIQQAETFRQPVPEQAPVKAEPNEQQVPPSPKSAVAMPQPQAVTSQIKIEGGAVIQLLHHMSRVFRGNMPVIPPALHIDSKRRRRLQEKRMAMGHKQDDHEDERLYHVNDNAMQ